MGYDVIAIPIGSIVVPELRGLGLRVWRFGVEGLGIRV